jgi:hypothetical protein
MKTLYGILAFAVAIPLSACGAYDSAYDGAYSEESDAAWEPLTESSCLFAASDDLLLLHPVNQIAQNLRSQSPTGYNNPKCSKSWVVSLPTVPRFSWYGVYWTDKWARNRAQCVGGSLSVRIMSRTNVEPIPAFYSNEATVTAPLRFGTSPTSSRCYYPSFYFSAGASWFSYYPGDVTGEVDWNAFPPVSVDLRNLEGRSVKIAAQALTPGGTTQSVTVYASVPPF